MATITTDLICNLNQPVAATFLHGNLFSQDNAGNTINVHVMDNGEPATIGGTVSANVIRADGNTVAVSGSLSGNQCSVVLPQACYAVPGRVEIIIKLTQSTTITTIAAIVANVYRSTTDTVVDPGTIIPSIQALIEEIEDAVDSIPVDYSGLLATIAADYSSSKTYQVGQYAWQGGVLKRCIVPITTAETYTAAHWTNAVLGDDVSALKSAFDEVTEIRPGTNIFDGVFDESGYIDATGNKASANFKRTSGYVPIYGVNRGYVYFYLSATVDTFTVFFYDSTKTLISGSSVQVSNVQTKTGVLPPNAAYFRAYTRVAFSGNVTIALTSVNSYIPYEEHCEIKENEVGVKQLDSEVKSIIGYNAPHTYITKLDPTVVTGFYLVDTNYTPYGVAVESGKYRMKLKDSGGNVVVNGEDVAPEFYSDKIQRFVDPLARKVVAYYILHRNDTTYSLDSDSLAFTASATSLDDNPVIKEYLSRQENLVLIGDSMFGNNGKNVLEALLSTITNKQVFNCGFGGCDMAWRTSGGTNDYDVFSFVSIADAIVANDFSAQVAKAGLNQAYPYRCASLKSIDFTKPTTIFVEYVNNDITGNIPIGDEWDYQEANFNKQTVLGAFNYGVKTLLTAYPHIRIVQFTSAWRKLGSPAVPPHLYQNTLGKTPIDYNEAIKSNASKIGIAVYDFFNDAGRNYYNTSYYQVDSSHYNEKGYALFAKVLDALSRSFKD